MGGLSHRMHVEEGEEFQELEHAINTMAGRLEEKYSGFESRCKEWTDQLHNSMRAAEDRARQLSHYSRDLATISRLTSRVFNNADLSLDDMLDRFMRGITRGTWDLPSGPAIVCVLGAFLVLFAGWRAVRGRLQDPDGL